MLSKTIAICTLALGCISATGQVGKQVSLDVLVTDAAGTPISQATLEICSENAQFSTIVDQHGDAVTRIPPDRYVITVQAVGFEDWNSAPLQLRSDSAWRVALRVKPTYEPFQFTFDRGPDFSTRSPDVAVSLSSVELESMHQLPQLMVKKARAHHRWW